MAWPPLAPALLNWLSRPESTAHPAWAEDLQGLAGDQPLPWWAAGFYRGQARHELLRLRDQPRPAGLAPWLAGLLPLLETSLGHRHRPTLVVPVPSWKRQANPLPGLLAAALCRQLGWPTSAEPSRRFRLPGTSSARARRCCSLTTFSPRGQRPAQLRKPCTNSTGGWWAWPAWPVPQPGSGKAVTYDQTVVKATGRDSSVGRAGD
jgi:hypothetical protein